MEETKFWFYFNITIDSEIFEDAMKGFTVLDALIAAQANWVDASCIEYTGKVMALSAYR